MCEKRTPETSAMSGPKDLLTSGSISAVGPWGPVYTSYFGPTVTLSSCGRPLGPITPITYAEPEGRVRELTPLGSPERPVTLPRPERSLPDGPAAAGSQ